MFDNHLNKSKVNYSNHFLWAITAGCKLIYAGFASIIHAFIPSWFEGTAAKIVIELYYTRLENHPNTDYKEYIEQSKLK
jgi:hypothetical protein